MDVFSSLSSYIWGDGEQEPAGQGDGTQSPDLSAPVPFLDEHQEVDEEWILVGKDGKKVKKHSQQEVHPEQKEDEEEVPSQATLETSIIEQQSDEEEEEEEEEEESDYEEDEVEMHDAQEVATTTCKENHQACNTGLSKRQTLNDLKSKVSTDSRRKDGRKNLKRSNKVNANIHVSSKKSKQMARKQGKNAGMGGKRCGWH